MIHLRCKIVSAQQALHMLLGLRLWLRRMLLTVFRRQEVINAQSQVPEKSALAHQLHLTPPVPPLSPRRKLHTPPQEMWSAPRPTMAGASCQRKELSARSAECHSQMELLASAQDSWCRRRSSASQGELRDSAMSQDLTLSAHARLQKLSSKIMEIQLHLLRAKVNQVATSAFVEPAPASARCPQTAANALALQKF